MEKLDKEFKDLLENRTLTDLRKHSGAVYGVWGDMRLGYLSPGWFRFAKENGGEPSISVDWGLGKSILDSTTNNVRDFYEAKLNACMNSGEVWKHEYECSIHQIYRRFHQVAYPLGQREGLLLVNSIVVEQPHDLVERPVQAADVGIYTDENGLICQCAHCRRVKDFREEERWDWVPDWVTKCPDNTSHTFCPTCFGFYYPSSTHE